MPGALGRRPPSDWTHVDKYPLTAATAPSKPSPVVIGVNWYTEFDNPQKDEQGHYWIARDAGWWESLVAARRALLATALLLGALYVPIIFLLADDLSEPALVGVRVLRMLYCWSALLAILWPPAVQKSTVPETGRSEGFCRISTVTCVAVLLKRGMRAVVS